MADAPVCHDSQDQVIGQPPAKELPSIPTADPSDLGSIVAAINALTQFVLRLAGQSGSQGAPGVPGQPGKAAPKNKIGRFIEVGRATEEVQIHSKDDPEVYVTVKRINRLVFRDSVTGEIWSWSL